MQDCEMSSNWLPTEKDGWIYSKYEKVYMCVNQKLKKKKKKKKKWR